MSPFARLRRFACDRARLDKAVDRALWIENLRANFYVGKRISAMAAPDCQSLKPNVKLFSGLFGSE